MSGLLSSGKIEVWRVDLNNLPLPETTLAQWLTDEEQAKAQRLRRLEDRALSIVARGLLRVLTGHYLGREPGLVRFVLGEFGKPRIAPEQNAADLRFNVSHSRQMVLLAFSQGAEVGIDVERILPDWPIREVAPTLFAGCEWDRWQALPPEARTAEFWRRWVRHEAWVKMRGRGLGASDGPLEDEPGDSHCFEDLDIGTEYAAAVACAAPVLQVTLREWTRETSGVPGRSPTRRV